MSQRKKKGRIWKENVEEEIWEVILIKGFGCWLTKTK
jgi:hypothetical protein